MNSRYIVDGHIVRQEWDLFDRGPDGFEAYRLQGETLADFRRKYPAFVRHWDPANFGQSWLQDYRLADPERRRDLDLPASSMRPDLRSPLALAFYWSRRIPSSGQAATVFLPGFKKDKSVDLTIAAAEPPGNGRQVWQTSIRYSALSRLMHPLSRLGFRWMGICYSLRAPCKAEAILPTVSSGRKTAPGRRSRPMIKETRRDKASLRRATVVSAVAFTRRSRGRTILQKSGTPR